MLAQANSAPQSVLKLLSKPFRRMGGAEQAPPVPASQPRSRQRVPAARHNHPAPSLLPSAGAYTPPSREPNETTGAFGRPSLVNGRSRSIRSRQGRRSAARRGPVVGSGQWNSTFEWVGDRPGSESPSHHLGCALPGGTIRPERPEKVTQPPAAGDPGTFLGLSPSLSPELRRQPGHGTFLGRPGPRPGQPPVDPRVDPPGTRGRTPVDSGDPCGPAPRLNPRGVSRRTRSAVWICGERMPP